MSERQNGFSLLRHARLSENRRALISVRGVELWPIPNISKFSSAVTILDNEFSMLTISRDSLEANPDKESVIQWK
jgi:hypothetical protein